MNNNTRTIAFLDTEIDPKGGKILDIGCIKSDGNIFHKGSVTDLVQFINGSEYVCGHNIIHHDLKYIGKTLYDAGIKTAIDTLFLSPLLFPTKPYHALVKDDKLQTDEVNNPLNDAIKAKDLFYDEISSFNLIDSDLQHIYYYLLHDKREFKGFFKYLSFIPRLNSLVESLINKRFANEICANVNLSKLITEQPIELAYCLSLINSFVQYKKIHSITPPWVLRKYPDVEQLILKLRNKPCVTGCAYCNNSLDIHKGLKHFFGFDAYRTFGGENLQAKAVQAAINNKSLLAVFPTGGGKSITFQVPALMAGENSNALTVVISPLQSLMKDQVDNLEKNGITQAVTINGLLDPIEKAKSFERVADGSASMLYISPESLRSKTIENLILGRKIARFVIDEAHCFSAWGHDFRVDYFYIGDFIRNIQKKKNLQDSIPVSCFTATAKQKVIEDIIAYFKDKLSIELELFTSKVSRTNLTYKVFENNDEEEKYQKLRDLIIENNCPTIVYVSRTRKAYLLAERLSNDGFKAKPYHGKMDVQEKSANQNEFINGDVQIMVATSAFGMGVDKKDVGMVVHFEISDSLENYIQEAGRAGRDENITADCYVLFNEEDLSKHFILLNQTKLSIKEIQQVWRAIKEVTKFRSSVSNSALEIARKAGWDDNVLDIETRVITAIAALEDAGYIRRGQNMPRVFANSILCKNAQEAIEKINVSEKFEEKQKAYGSRIIKKLFSSKSRKQDNDDIAETRVDYISDHLGIVREDVIEIINLLREEKILADAKDLTAYIRKSENKNRSLNIVETYNKIEKALFPLFEEQEKTFQIKELNETVELNISADVGINKIKTILNYWSIKNWLKRQNLDYSKNYFAAIYLQSKDTLQTKIEKRHELSRFIIEYLYDKSNLYTSDTEKDKDEALLEFSILELKVAYETSLSLFKQNISLDDIEDSLFYLSRIEAVKIEGGFLVVYNRLNIERLEQNTNKRYTKDDYEKLNLFYENKVQQIHIVGEYARKMIEDYRDALQFAEDYFKLNYSSFLNKYFPGSKANELKLRMTPAKFKKLFGELSPTQLKIINDNESKYIVVAAGPGSGKTRVLVHKLASLLLMEDVKHEQLLMLTFSRAAVTEFKKRLYSLIGNAASFVNIKTFHTFCFDLLGKVGNLDKSDTIIKNTVEKIISGDVETNRMTKTVLVIDEAQDINKDEFNLIMALIEQNEEMRVIAVGDDDQNIFEFRGADSKYLTQLLQSKNSIKYELVENYRSKNNLVEFTNQFVSHIHNRLKHTPVLAVQKYDGQISLAQYTDKNLITPLVSNILQSDLTGTTCVLTRTNEEALQISGLLIKNKISAKLIQSNDGFNLNNLIEIRSFLDFLNLKESDYVINDDVWEEAKKKLRISFQQSNKLEISINLIQNFEATNRNKKYKSDFDVYIKESKLEDFYNETGETIFVSTIHKAKGKEFDNIFLLLDNANHMSDAEKRLIYVAMTRAKNNLSIHTNQNIFSKIKTVENMIKYTDSEEYESPTEILIHLNHKDVWLDYFINRQSIISKLQSGDKLTIKDDECLNQNGQSVLKFSRQFLSKIEEMHSLGYDIKECKINFIVYWEKEEFEREFKIILPEVWFESNRLSLDI